MDKLKRLISQTHLNDKLYLADTFDHILGQVLFLEEVRQVLKFNNSINSTVVGTKLLSKISVFRLHLNLHKECESRTTAGRVKMD